MKMTFDSSPDFDKEARAFKNIPPLIDKMASDGMKKAAFLVEAEAKKRTPVDTGRLRASIFSTIYELTAAIQPKTDYAIYVHEGTFKMRARPFMAEGLEAAKGEIIKILGESVELSIKKSLS